MSYVTELTCMNNSILGHYTKFGGVGLDNFKFHRSHATTNKECVALADWSVCWKVG